ncbi:hypothetical protein DFH27DRAFT_582143 [Peziza echinospora]|nr:hypothetical protein DFH27DRAFT_582143 [Peziza echinospora]
MFNHNTARASLRYSWACTWPALCVAGVAASSPLDLAGDVWLGPVCWANISAVYGNTNTAGAACRGVGESRRRNAGDWWIEGGAYFAVCGGSAEGGARARDDAVLVVGFCDRRRLLWWWWSRAIQVCARENVAMCDGLVGGRCMLP